MGVITIDPKDISVTELNGYLLGTISPRPIAFASTVDKNGKVNLSPFSFFNVFSTKPPILIFSPSRRVRDNTTKHTLENILEVPEVVINTVSYSLVQQTSLASVEYAKGVNEFTKAGFTEVHSQCVKPPRVGESPASFECKVNQVIPLGTEGGAGNLIICEILLMHFKEVLFDASGKIDPNKVDAVARMGGDFYCRVNGDNIFTVPKPNSKQGIGFDQIPLRIRNSKILTGNDLGMLGNIERLPNQSEIHKEKQSVELMNATRNVEEGVHLLAKKYLSTGEIEKAWLVLLSAE
ncbi:MAG: flavin reductase family protein [Bacteroidia bacterium]|nr:flavin reductase family protein [Bacteroidia bacterium]